MSLTDVELIARQAKQLEDLRDEVAALKERVRVALSLMYCIGGPLNDNRLHYTGEQLVTFSRIAEALEQ